MNRHAQAEFNAWVTRHHSELRKHVSRGIQLSEDAFQEAYLSTWGIVGREDNERTFGEQFAAAYKEAIAREYDYRDSHVSPDPIFFDFLREEEDGEEQTRDDVDCRQVQEYVRRRFPATDYALFRLIYVDGPRGGRRPATWGAACTP